MKPTKTSATIARCRRLGHKRRKGDTPISPAEFHQELASIRNRDASYLALFRARALRWGYSWGVAPGSIIICLSGSGRGIM
jgi:hypothetical protein